MAFIELIFWCSPIAKHSSLWNIEQADGGAIEGVLVDLGGSPPPQKKAMGKSLSYLVRLFYETVTWSSASPTKFYLSGYGLNLY